MNKLGKNKLMVYGLVLAAAVVGLVIDRLARSEAEPAAESYAVARPATAAGAKPAVTLAGEAVVGPAIARVFEQTGAQASNSPQSRPAAVPLAIDLPLFGTVRIASRDTGRAAHRDAFEMSPKMRSIYEEPTPEMKALEQQQRESLQQQRREAIARFKSTNPLRGTTVDGNSSWAIIGDRIVRIGQKIDGFELKRVERYHVVLAADDVEIVLSLPMP